MSKKGTAIVWFRRDLRLIDQPALAAALNFETVLPIYIDDPKHAGDWPMGRASRWWLSKSLAVLHDKLQALGAGLRIYQGNTTEILCQLVKAHQAKAVYWNRLYDPATVTADKALKQTLRATFANNEICVESFCAHVLKEPWHMLKKDQTPYLVFTPYWKHFQATWTPPEPVPPPERLKLPSTQDSYAHISAESLAPEQVWHQKLSKHWQAGCVSGQERLEAFAKSAVGDYDTLRNRPDHAGTSALSPHLHFGEISVGQVIRAFDPAGELPLGQGPLSFVREIVWREFSHYLLFYFPHLTDQPLKPVFNDFPWRAPEDYQADLVAWQQGKTGVPMVDAGMRQLWMTGWMHNRVRMVVASYLTKNLLIPWQEGARWFWDTLVDADLANNTQGWQWTAGCGADASPYFRVFNPVLQGEKFDPMGEYVKHWCPERQANDKKTVHLPNEGIDLKAQRQRALDAYAELKKGR